MLGCFKQKQHSQESDSDNGHFTDDELTEEDGGNVMAGISDEIWASMSASARSKCCDTWETLQSFSPSNCATLGTICSGTDLIVPVTWELERVMS